MIAEVEVMIPIAEPGEIRKEYEEQLQKVNKQWICFKVYVLL